MQDDLVTILEAALNSGVRPDGYRDPKVRADAIRVIHSCLIAVVLYDGRAGLLTMNNLPFILTDRTNGPDPGECGRAEGDCAAAHQAQCVSREQG